MIHLLDWLDVPQAQWEDCVKGALRHAEDKVLGKDSLAGKKIALVFFNDSLRTRVSMEIASADLGMKSVTITPGSGTWGFSWDKEVPMKGAEAEHIQEAVGVLSRYTDAIGVRLFASGKNREQDDQDSLLRQLADASEVPVLNLESASRHPCQALADASVLTKHFSGQPRGKKLLLTWAYHPKALPMAVPNSTLLMASRLGMKVCLARPSGFELEDSVMQSARRLALENGGSVVETDDLQEGTDGAQIVYAKSWGSSLRYDDPVAESGLREKHADWIVSREVMARTDDGAFMHCLPVRRGVVVENEVLDSESSLHLDQAEYRLYAQKAILRWLMETNGRTQ